MNEGRAQGCNSGCSWGFDGKFHHNGFCRGPGYVPPPPTHYKVPAQALGELMKSIEALVMSARTIEVTSETAWMDVAVEGTYLDRVIDALVKVREEIK